MLGFLGGETKHQTHTTYLIACARTVRYRAQARWPKRLIAPSANGHEKRQPGGSPWLPFGGSNWKLLLLVHSGFESGTSAETGHGCRCDFQLLASAWVLANACGTLGSFEGTKANQLHVLFFGNGLGDDVNQSAYCTAGSGFGHVSFFGQRFNQFCFVQDFSPDE
jgi:hypothetical protein